MNNTLKNTNNQHMVDLNDIQTSDTTIYYSNLNPILHELDRINLINLSETVKFYRAQLEKVIIDTKIDCKNTSSLKYLIQSYLLIQNGFVAQRFERQSAPN